MQLTACISELGLMQCSLKTRGEGEGAGKLFIFLHSQPFS